MNAKQRWASIAAASLALALLSSACSSSKKQASTAKLHVPKCDVRAVCRAPRPPAAATSAAASSSSSAAAQSSAPAATGGTFTISDPYPQYTAGSSWVNLLNSCGASAGVKIKRTGYDTTALLSQTLLSAQQGNSPDVLIVDNPVVSTFADAGCPHQQRRRTASTPSAIAPNILARRRHRTARRTASRSARTPSRCTTTRRSSRLPASIPATIKSLGRPDRRARQGEGDRQEAASPSRHRHRGGQLPVPAVVLGFRREPDQPRLDPRRSPRCTLWTTWIKDGYAPNSVIQDTQTTSWQEFQTGKYAFAENGTWQKANADKMGSRTASSRSRPRTAARRRCRPAASSSRSRCRRTRRATPTSAKIVQLPDVDRATSSPPTTR